MKTIIRNGRIIDPANGRDEIGDLVLVDGVIVSQKDDREAEIIDATGLVVAPGLIDIHVHLREPGFSWKETIESGARAAATGGFTTIVCMPNTSPVADSPSRRRASDNPPSLRIVATVLVWSDQLMMGLCAGCTSWSAFF